MLRSIASAAPLNRILAALPAEELAALTPQLELVQLATRTVIHEADSAIEDVYFPVAGVAALVATGEGGEEVDTAIIGREGLVGLPVFLGTRQMPVRAIVQVELTALRLGADQLRGHIDRGGELPGLLQRYSQMVIVELALLILCNRAHSLEHRIARWILQLDERLDSPAPFPMTQEFLAAMVSSPRPHVAQVLQSLRERELIDYSRGTMEVVDAVELEKAACACFRAIRRELDRLLGAAV